MERDLVRWPPNKPDRTEHFVRFVLTWHSIPQDSKHTCDEMVHHQAIDVGVSAPRFVCPVAVLHVLPSATEGRNCLVPWLLVAPVSTSLVKLYCSRGSRVPFYEDIIVKFVMDWDAILSKSFKRGRSSKN